MLAVVLTEVSPFYENQEGLPSYRSCDFCFQTACEDIWAGKLNEEDWRRFYLLPDGCCVCENCIDKVETA